MARTERKRNRASSSGTEPPALPTRNDDAFLERLARLEAVSRQLLEHRQDQEDRIRRLERAVWIFSGAAAAAGGVIGSVLGSLGG